MNVLVPNIIKSGLAVLLLICLFDMPYGFYQLVRFAAMVGFAILAFVSFKFHRVGGMIIYISLAVLFQPLIKIALGRTIWNVVDGIVAIGLLLSIFFAGDVRLGDSGRREG